VRQDIKAQFGEANYFHDSPEELSQFLAARGEAGALLVLYPWLHQLEAYLACVEEAAKTMSGRLGVIWVVDKKAYVARLMRSARLLKCWSKRDEVIMWGGHGWKGNMGSSQHHEGYAMYYWNGSVVEERHVRPSHYQSIPLECHPNQLPQAKLSMHGEDTRLMIVIGHSGSTSIKILIDSGASQDFVSAKLVSKLKIDMHELATPMRVKLANGANSVTKHGVDISLNIGEDYKDRRSFVITALEGVDMVLGMPWLTQYDPDIKWSTHTITYPFRIQGVATVLGPSIQMLDASRMARVLKQARKGEGEVYVMAVKGVGQEDSASTDLLTPCTDLPPEQEQQLHALLQGRATFDEPRGVNRRGRARHRIQLKGEPKSHGHRRMSPAELEVLRSKLDEFLENGWLRPAPGTHSNFAAPVVFAKKPDGSLRFCVDYRALNEVTVKDNYPLPRVDELLDQLHGAKYFTTMDLSSAYYQIPMHEDDVYKTTFSTRYGLFEWVVMPMGLSNSPATCQRVMNEMLGPYLDKFAFIYLDDIMIFSKTAEEHLMHVQLVLEALDRYNFKVKLTKCTFAKRQTRFLGYLVSDEGVAADPAKVAAVVNWPVPTSVTEVRRFLGFCNFYRRFIKNFSAIAAPLTELTSAMKVFPNPLPVEATDAMRALQSALVSTPVLRIPQTGPDSTFQLYTDASIIAVGAVLEQDGHPICYESRKLNAAERNYAVHELEMLAIVHALRTFRHYLEGCQSFVLYTDHHSLQYFFRQKDLSRRQAGWAEVLADFQPNMTVKYLPGETNRADALSRMLADARMYGMFEVKCGNLREELLAGYANDAFYADPRAYVRKDSETGLFYFKDRICVPNVPALRLRLLAEFHDAPSAGHAGVLRTLNLIASKYWWHKMGRDVRRYVNSCELCQRIKGSSEMRQGLLRPHAVPTRPWSHIAVDLITDLPLSKDSEGHEYDAICTFVDLLTKQAFFVRTTKSLDSVGLAHLYIDHVYRVKGLSRFIVSDRDVRMTADFWKTLMLRLGTYMNLSTAYHPQTDGQAERTHATIEQILRGCVNGLQDDWAAWLPVCEFAYNSSVHSAIKMSPFMANYGYQPDSPATLVGDHTRDFAQELHEVHKFVIREAEAAKAYMAASANRWRRDVAFTVGDRVWLDTDVMNLREQPSRKFRDRWAGPYEVVKVVNPVSYELALPAALVRMHPVFHVSRLKRFRGPERDFAGRPEPRRPLPVVTDIEQSEEFVVDRLLRARVGMPGGSKTPELEFLVRWAAPFQDPKWDSWEPKKEMNKTRAMTEFLLSDTWKEFLASDEMMAFARRYPKRVPK